MANAHSFMVNVCTPMASAASSSSRMADQARPTRERPSRMTTTRATPMAARVR